MPRISSRILHYLIFVEFFLNPYPRVSVLIRVPIKAVKGEE
jgi:hypothetical protein